MEFCVAYSKKGVYICSNKLKFKLMANSEQITKAVAEISKAVNTFGSISPEFNALMSREHRTLQNSFTRLCLGWLEHIASEEYKTDPRNESGAAVSRKLMQLFREHVKSEGWSESTLDMYGKPSGWVAFV